MQLSSMVEELEEEEESTGCGLQRQQTVNGLHHIQSLWECEVCERCEGVRV